VGNTVGSLKRHVNLSLVDAEGKILVPDLRGESVDQLIREGLAKRVEANSTRDVSLYRLTPAGIARAASNSAGA
jgi:hypothetical protein